MKDTITLIKPSKSSTQRARFNFLKSMYHQAPLPKDELEELKTLAKQYDPKMAEHLESNSECWVAKVKKL